MYGWHNFLQLNQDKTEVLVIGEKAEREKLSAHLKTLALNTKHQARNLGVIFDLISQFWNPYQKYN